MSQFEPNLINDDLLLQQVEKGSTRAFDALFDKYWEWACSEAYNRLRDLNSAKDIVQEVFTQIWINRQTTHIENLPAYLRISIRNKVIKVIAKQKPVHPFFDLLDNIPEMTSRADAPLLWKEFLIVYEALLESLPPKRQEIFRLRFQRDLSTKEISLQMGITTKTVQNQLAKAIATLKISLLRLLILSVILSIA